MAARVDQDRVIPRSSDSGVVAVLVTGPSAEDLSAIGERLVNERIAACMTVIPGATSVYRWEGAVETASEAFGIIKTTEDRLSDLEVRLTELHPYDVPEILALRAPAGSARYLDWVRESVTRGSGDGQA